MKTRLTLVAAIAAAAMTAAAITPAQASNSILSFMGSPDPAYAAVTKSRDAGDAAGGSANVSRAGDRLGDLLSGWAVPILTVIAGCLLIGALASRNIGASVGIVVITVVGLIFLLRPKSIEGLAEGIANFVF